MIPTEIGGGKMGSSSQCYGNTRTSIELETKVHPKIRNHGEGPYFHI